MEPADDVTSLVLPETKFRVPEVEPNATPDATITLPLPPAAVVPVLSTIAPLDPTDTAFALLTYTAPLDDDPPAPLTTLITPPTLVDDVVSPAFTYTFPPLLDVDVPTYTLTEPARPLVASPDRNMMLPDPPFTADPVPIVIPPELPDFVVPLLNTTDPLDPAEIAFALRISTNPELDDWPPPLPILTVPPVAVVSIVNPAWITTLPPLPVSP